MTDKETEHRPTMSIYDEAEDGPAMLLLLPISIVETLVDVAYRHITPSMGLDGAFTDELRSQLAAFRAWQHNSLSPGSKHPSDWE